MGHAGPTMNTVTLRRRTSRTTRRTLAPIATVANGVTVLAVHPSLPVTSVAEFIDYAKKNPARTELRQRRHRIRAPHPGELLKQKTGIDMLHVPYRGGGPAIQDLVAGTSRSASGPRPRCCRRPTPGPCGSWRWRKHKRSPDLPGVPTVAETVPGVVTMTWVGLFAPAGTPGRSSSD